MDFDRKILSKMKEWKDTGLCRKKALLIKGLRQIGKTYAVTKFAKENYENVIYLDFRADKRIRTIFDGDFDVDGMTLQLTALGKGPFIPGKTAIIMDEVQDCSNARSSVKYFVLDGRYDVIETGSLLGIRGYNRSEDRGTPMGFEHILHMRPMDFEEFLWAKSVDPAVIGNIRKCFLDRRKPAAAVNDAMTRLFREYICVGGMPEAVSSLLESKDFLRVRSIQRGLLEQHRDDFGKYIAENGSIMVDLPLKMRINSVFESIPAQLSKEYKKFQYSVLSQGSKSSQYTEAIQWLEAAGLVSICYNLKNTDLPFEGNKNPDAFKIYMADSGLFISMLEPDAVSDIINGNLGTYKGAIYEQIVADMLSKMGRPLYYYRRDASLEIDFVIRYLRKPTIMEVKARDGRAKAARKILEDQGRYGVERCIKITESAFGDSEGILTIPHYMAFMLDEGDLFDN